MAARFSERSASGYALDQLARGQNALIEIPND
jgi:hypothetical protein